MVYLSLTISTCVRNKIVDMSFMYLYIPYVIYNKRINVVYPSLTIPSVRRNETRRRQLRRFYCRNNVEDSIVHVKILLYHISNVECAWSVCRRQFTLVEEIWATIRQLPTCTSKTKPQKNYRTVADNSHRLKKWRG